MKIGLQTLRKALVAAAAVASLGATAQTVRIANQGDALSMVSTTWAAKISSRIVFKVWDNCQGL